MLTLDRLLKELEERPDDLKLQQQIAGAYERRSEWELAAPYYLRVADLYTRDGFFLKAIAMTKQVLKRSPQRIELNLRLAEWNVRLELRSEARTYFEVARVAFAAAGRRNEARQVQRRIDELVAGGALDEVRPIARA